MADLSFHMRICRDDMSPITMPFGLVCSVLGNVFEP